MQQYNFDKEINTGKFTVQIDSAANYGYFEHNFSGEDYSGGLWFENGELIDYDGVTELPQSVITAIEKLGFNADYAKE